MTENLPKHRASRAGYRAHLTQILEKAGTLMAKETPTEVDLVSLKNILEQLARKKDKIKDLDERIAALLEDTDEIEKEAFDTEVIQDNIDETSSQISNFLDILSSKKTPNTVPPSTVGKSLPLPHGNASGEVASGSHIHQSPPLETSTLQVNGQSGPPLEPQGVSNEISQPLSQVIQYPSNIHPPEQSPPVPTLNSAPLLSSNQTTSSHNHSSRLPKLNLPTFSGNPLHWFTFWDSFEAAVHSNTSLGGVQKFTYLKAQLMGDASRAVTGFPLTNSNYEQAITLLRERFGQPNKIINAHMQAFLDLPKSVYELSSLQVFYDTMENHVRGLESLGRSHETYGDLLVPIVLGKLPSDMRTNLARDHDSHEWKFQQLRESILKEIRILEIGVHTNSSSPTHMGASAAITNSFLTQAQGRPPVTPQFKPPRTRGKCTYCKGPHPAYNCNVITDCQERWAIIKGEKLCFNCLGNHKSTACQSRYRCHKCRGKHHTSLCTGTPPITPNFHTSLCTGTPPITPNSSLRGTYQHQGPSNPNISPQTTSQHQHPSTAHVHATLAPIHPTPPTSTAHLGHASLLKTAIATVCTDYICCEANILFDEGAQRSFITHTLAKQLGLETSVKESIHLSAFGGQTSAVRQLPLATVNVLTTSGEKIPLHVLVVEKIATPLQTHMHQGMEDLTHLRGLKLAHPITSDQSFDVSLLIGADHYWDLVEDHVIRGHGPTAVASKIGYLLSGPLQTSSGVSSTTVVNLLQTISSTKRDELDLEKFWSLEAMGISPQSEQNDHEVFLENYISTSITRNQDGSYIAKFPWRDDSPMLPTNYNKCEQRTRSMVRRLAATPQLLATYGNIIAEHETRGFIERVDDPQPTDNAHYIPHHPVKKDSATTPIRIVYDCSFHSSPDNPSLNNCLLVGPPFLHNMCSILLRFRTFTYGLSTDIEKAFLHVGLDDSDRDFTRFFWLSDPEDPESDFQVYRFKTVLFGSTSSPFMLNATLHHHLDNYITPVAEDMKENIYVDNVISGCDQELEALDYYKEARSIMNEALFNLRSWSSNSSSLRDQATRDGTADTNEIVNILGLKWDPSSDTLTLTSSKDESARRLVTKRNVLQVSSKVYDPLGLLSPVTIRAKLLIQELWQQQLEWDEPLSPELSSQWHEIAQNIEEAATITLHRRFFASSEMQPTAPYLHVFADASSKAYGAVSYITSGDQCSLVMAKSRVAPLKKLTLPQLELMAALTGARLAKFVSQALKSRYPNLNVKLWSDSEIVLHWLSSSKPLKQFVANRTKEIKGMFPIPFWNHCPTADNPADFLTRGISAQQLQSSSLWKYGPQWLLSESQWPHWKPSQVLHLSLSQSLEEETSSGDSVPTQPPEEKTGIHRVVDISRYSALSKLVGVTAYVLRFLNHLRKCEPKHVGPLSAKERHHALQEWIKNCQALTYFNEIANLTSHSQSRLPLVRQLRLFLDSGGLLRCGGRIHNAPLDDSAKFPFLLPPRHPL